MDSVVEHGEKGWRERERKGMVEERDSSGSAKESFLFSRDAYGSLLILLLFRRIVPSSLRDFLARRTVHAEKPTFLVKRSSSPSSSLLPLARYLPPPPPLYTGNGIVIESYIDNLSTIRFLPFQDYILIERWLARKSSRVLRIDCLVMEIVFEKVSSREFYRKFIELRFTLRVSNTRIVCFVVRSSFSSYFRIIRQGRNIMVS